MKRLQKALKGEKGFTLVELMIVIGIIIILASILIVQWRGARQRAYDSQALSVCRNAAVAAQIYYNDKNQTYQGMTKDELIKIEPTLGQYSALEFTVTVSASGDDFVIVTHHPSGTKWYRATRDKLETLDTAPTP